MTREQLDALVDEARELSAEYATMVKQCDLLHENCKETQARLLAMLDQVDAGLEELQAAA